MSNIQIRQGFFYGTSYAASANAPLESLADINSRLNKPVEQVRTASHVNPKNQEAYDILKECYSEIASINAAQAKVHPAKAEETALQAPESRRIAYP